MQREKCLAKNTMNRKVKSHLLAKFRCVKQLQMGMRMNAVQVLSLMRIHC